MKSWRKTIVVALVLLLALACAFTLAACGAGGNNEGNSAGESSAPNEDSDAGEAEAPDEAAVSSDAGNTPEQVNVGYFSYVDETVLVKEKGYFDDYLKEKGSKANWVQFEAGRDINNAILADSLDIAGGIGDPPIAIAVESDTPYKVIYIECVTGTAEGLVVRESKGIDKIADLKGSTIATVVTSTSHYSLLSALEANGLTENDVEVLDLTAPDSVAAWERGDIDAVYTWDPNLSVLLENGGKLLTNSEEVAAAGSPVSNYVIVRTAFAEEYPETVTEFLRDMIKADTLYKENPDDAGAAWASFLSITPEEALQQAGGSNWLAASDILSPERLGTPGDPGKTAEALKKVGDFLVDQKSLTTKQDISKYQAYLDSSYLEEATKA
jgi:taurine transport system substrate-binding protein